MIVGFVFWRIAHLTTIKGAIYCPPSEIILVRSNILLNSSFAVSKIFWIYFIIQINISELVQITSYRVYVWSLLASVLTSLAYEGQGPWFETGWRHIANVVAHLWKYIPGFHHAMHYEFAAKKYYRHSETHDLEFFQIFDKTVLQRLLSEKLPQG